ncbi:hypothetical protein CCP3SC1AL1_770009 [Gammaproteobacteria bacterium]
MDARLHAATDGEDFGAERCWERRSPG